MTPPPPTLPALLTELVPALEHIHGLHLVHRDLKPENILLRSREPLDLVLADFGLVRLVEGSVHLSRGEGTDGYLPPEADLEEAEVTPAWDWWSLGIICAELAGGRHPFAQADGTMVPAAQIRRHFAAQRPVPLEHLADPRERLLCRGLLIADREQRWGAREVRAWLAGESPEVPEAVAAPGTRTVLFAGRDHESARALAAAFQEHWEEALRRLFQERDALLVEELTALLREEGRQEALTALSEQLLPAEVGVRFARLLLEMDPQLAPRVGPLTATPAGLGEAARRIARDAAGSTELKAALRELRRCAVLRSWRGLPGMARGPEIEGAWLALIAAWEALPGGLPGERPDPGLAAAWLLLVALDPERRSAELRAHVQAGAQTAAADCPPWAALAGRTDDPVALVAAMLTQGAAEMRGRELLAEREERRRAEEKAAEARRVAEAERRRAEEKAAEERQRAEENARRAEEERLRAAEERRKREEEERRLAEQRERHAKAAERALALKTFAGVEEYNLASLAAAFQARWPEALTRVLREPSLHRALAELLMDSGQAAAAVSLQTLTPGEEAARSSAAVRLLLAMNPRLKPQVNGVDITRDGLRRAAERLIAAPEDTELAGALIKIRETGVLTAWSSLPGCEDGPRIEALWRHHVAELEQLRSPEAPTWLQSEPKRWAAASALRLSAAEISSAGAAWLLLTALDPAQAETLDDMLGRAIEGPAGEVDWWQSLATDPSLAARALAAATAQRAEARGEEQRENARRREEAAEAERRRRARRIGRMVAWLAAALVSLAMPWLLLLLAYRGGGASAINSAGPLWPLLCYLVGPGGCIFCIYRAFARPRGR